MTDADAIDPLTIMIMVPSVIHTRMMQLMSQWVVMVTLPVILMVVVQAMEMERMLLPGIQVLSVQGGQIGAEEEPRETRKELAEGGKES